MLYPSDPIDDVPPTILIADDDTLLRKLLMQSLRKDGYQFVEATDGLEAIEIYKSVQPDIVLLDGSMPKMDGFTCCKQLRSLASIYVLPIIMITVLDDEASVNAAFDAGATDYIHKPINWFALGRRVKLLLDMTQLHRKLQKANDELRKIALMDALTGLFNRRSLDDMLAREWHRCIRNEEPLSLIMCDVDCFKPFNDTYGHPAGDRCLQQVGQVIRSSIRWTVDIGARYGGEEFAIVLPNTILTEAVTVAERIRTGVQELQIPHKGTLVKDEIYVTLSLGVNTSYPLASCSIDSFIQEADRKLYQAKDRGRNRVVFDETQSRIVTTPST
jgi:diguanylate cyclase (GGDEF)-like protein